MIDFNESIALFEKSCMINDTEIISLISTNTSAASKD